MPRFEPVDHDPFASPQAALMPVDHDPFMTSPEDAFAYGQGIPKDATWKNLLPAVEFGLGMGPGSGEAMSARDAWNASGRGAQALTEGRFGDAAGDYLDMGTAVLGAIPGAGIVARGTKRGAAWMDRNLPQGMNKLLDAVYPNNPRDTMMSFGGPTTDTPAPSLEELGKQLRDALARAEENPIPENFATYQKANEAYRAERLRIESLPQESVPPQQNRSAKAKLSQGVRKRRISGPEGSPGRPRSNTEHLVYRGQPEVYDDRLRPETPAFFSNDPRIADIYASQMYAGQPVIIQQSKGNITSPEDYARYIYSPEYQKGLSSPGKSRQDVINESENMISEYRPNTMAAWIDTEGFKAIDVDNTVDLDRKIEEARKQGYKGIIANNMKDVGGVQTQYVTWTPNTVRSAISDNTLYNMAPYLMAPAIASSLYTPGDE